MRLSRLVPLAFFLALALTTARAQDGDFYGTFALAHIGTSTVTTSQVSGITDTYTPAKPTYNAFGATAGFTLNFINAHTQQLGVDIRETIAPSSTNGVLLTLGGLRYSVFPRHSHIHPYVELAGGGAIERSTYTDTNVIVNGPLTMKTVDPNPGFTGHGAFAALAGVDLRIKPIVSFRAEFGGGHMGGSFAGDGPGGGALVLFNTGVVFHFDY